MALQQPAARPSVGVVNPHAFFWLRLVFQFVDSPNGVPKWNLWRLKP
jgi:hypothetical protein